ncbi:MAG: alpha/beta hydrolase [Pseudomonadales bacterium]|nr:alpha/beta hydrolase [Pseudomonadales bacterium]
MRVVVDGESVFVGQGSGHGEGLAILMLHGAGMDHTVWTLPARYFARHGYRVIAPDLPAHGRSAGKAMLSIADMAAWAWRLLDVLGVDRAVVLGHSMGSLIAASMAASAPARVLALGLLGTSQPMRVSDPLLDAARDDDPAAFAMANTWSHSARGRLGGNPQPGIWLMASGSRLLDRNRPGVYAADLSACNAFEPVAPADGLSVPVLILAGEADQMTPLKAALGVASAFPACTVRRLPGCGHSMLGEKPNEVLDALAGLVDAVSVS